MHESLYDTREIPSAKQRHLWRHLSLHMRYRRILHRDIQVTDYFVKLPFSFRQR